MFKSRMRDRPRVRWLDDVLEDLRRMDVRGYARWQWKEDIRADRYWKPGLILGWSAKAVSYTHLDVYKRQI